MFAVYLKRYRGMILCSIFFFYLGCKITLSLLNIECVDAVSRTTEVSEQDKIEYAVLILSGPDYESRRDTIRATWMNFAANIIVENGERLYKWNHTWTAKGIPQNFIKFYFVIGIKGMEKQKLLQLTSENVRTNDLLLLEDLEDSYKSLAEKMLKALKWFSENLKRLKYLIKCDDDSFVRVDLIIRDLETFAPEMNAPEISEFVSYKKSLPTYKGFYWGYFNGKARVYQKGKWREDDWFLCNSYLPYALGGGYVVSRSIVDYVADNAGFMSLYHSEDVSMGVWTAPLADINRVHDIRFDTEWKSRGCDNHMLVRHKQTTSDMFQMYKALVNSKGKILCDAKTVIRKSYRYNWSVLPSLCCDVPK